MEGVDAHHICSHSLKDWGSLNSQSLGMTKLENGNDRPHIRLDIPSLSSWLMVLIAGSDTRVHGSHSILLHMSAGVTSNNNETIYHYDHIFNRTLKRLYSSTDVWEEDKLKPCSKTYTDKSLIDCMMPTNLYHLLRMISFLQMDKLPRELGVWVRSVRFIGDWQNSPQLLHISIIVL